MDFYQRLKEKILPILINRTAIFFFVICIFILFLYAAGTVQGFVDSTQISLLSFYMVSGISLAFASLAGMLINIGIVIKIRKTRYILRATAYFFLIVFALVTVLAVMAIIAISEGNIA